MKVEAEVWEVRDGEVITLKYDNKLYKLVKPTIELNVNITDKEAKRVYVQYRIHIKSDLLSNLNQFLTT